MLIVVVLKGFMPESFWSLRRWFRENDANEKSRSQIGRENSHPCKWCSHHRRTSDEPEVRVSSTHSWPHWCGCVRCQVAGYERTPLKCQQTIRNIVGLRLLGATVSEQLRKTNGA